MYERVEVMERKKARQTDRMYGRQVGKGKKKIERDRERVYGREKENICGHCSPIKYPCFD